MMKKTVMVGLMVAALALSANTATASLTMDSDIGIWTGTDGGTNVQYQTVVVGYGNGSENQVRWGVPYSAPDTIDNQSGLGFTGKAPSGSPVTFELGDAFEIGQISHFNHAIENGGSPTEAYLKLMMDFTTPDGPLSQTFNFTFEVDETPGGLTVPDIITFPSSLPAENVNIGGTLYTVELLGFGSSPTDLVSEFVSEENGQVNSTLLWGRITERPVVPVPGAVLLSSIGLGLVGYLRRRRAL
jgi:hypothetical protein